MSSKSKALKGIFSKSPIIVQLLVVLFLLLFGAVVGSVIFLSSGTNTLWGQGIISTFTFVVPAWFIYFLFTPGESCSFPSFYHLRQTPSIWLIILGILLILLSTPLINYLNEWNKQMTLPEVLSDVELWMKETEEQAAQLTQELLDVHDAQGLMQNLVVLALVPAIGEELIFRGTLIPMFNRYVSRHASVWTSAIIFSAIHLQFYGFIPRMVLGAFLGYLFVWSRSLWVSICAHFINNATVVLAAYLCLSDSVDGLGTKDEPGMVILSLLATTGILYCVFHFTSGPRSRASVDCPTSETSCDGDT